MNRTFAYVCAPNDGSYVALVNLRKYCRQLYELGYLPVCPTLMFSRFLSKDVAKERQSERTMSMDILRRCRVLVVCSNTLTKDMESEILLARRLGITAATLAGIQRISLQTESGEV